MAKRDRKQKRGTLPTSFSLTKRGKTLLGQLAEYYGTNNTAVVEMLIRDRARQVGLLSAPSPDDFKTE